MLELPSRAEALAWAARLAAACRCPQELRIFGEDPELAGRRAGAPRGGSAG